MNWESYAWPAVAVLFVSLNLALVVWLDHRANVRQAELQMDLNTLSEERDRLRREVAGFNQLRRDDLKTASLTQLDLRQQMDRAATLINKYATDEEKRWVARGDGDSAET